jgi:hypothetical protein
VNRIREVLAALDTNEYLFAVRHAPDRPASAALLYHHLRDLHLYLPLQVFIELGHNLRDSELRDILAAVGRAQSYTCDLAAAAPEAIDRWNRAGAKKGDANIAAQLEAAGVEVLITENRHFLREIQDLPFEVISAAEAVSRLGEA